MLDTKRRVMPSSKTLFATIFAVLSGLCLAQGPSLSAASAIAVDVRPAADDTAVAPLDYKTLTQRSAAAAGSAHPLLLSMQRSSGAGEALSIAHKEEGDWWIVHVQGQTNLGGKTEKAAIDIVVVGKAGE